MPNDVACPYHNDVGHLWVSMWCCPTCCCCCSCGVILCIIDIWMAQPVGCSWQWQCLGLPLLCGSKWALSLLLGSTLQILVSNGTQNSGWASLEWDGWGRSVMALPSWWAHTWGLGSRSTTSTALFPCSSGKPKMAYACLTLLKNKIKQN